MKSLILGSNHASLSALFSKISCINAKNGPFDLVLIVGDLFPPSLDDSEHNALLSNTLSPEVPTLFTLGQRPIPPPLAEIIDKSASNQLAHNLIFLGKHGVYNTTQGLRIAYFGGSFDSEHYSTTEVLSSSSPYFSSSDVSSLINEINSATDPSSGEPTRGIDVLITHSLPTHISRYASHPFRSLTQSHNLDNFSVPAIADILAAAKPRYHFASQAAAFWERDPFSWPPHHRSASTSNQITRFISLGQFGSSAKQRYFYAFNLNLEKNDIPPVIPPNLTACPLDLPKPRISQKTQPQLPPAKRSRKFENVGWDDNDTSPNFIFQQQQQQQQAPSAFFKSNKKSRSDYQSANNSRRLNSSNDGANQYYNNDNQQQQNHPPPADYTCRICNIPGHWVKECPEKRKQNADRPSRKEITPSECWFCLSNPKVTKHLIASIGNDTYVTLPKGQLPIPGSSNVPGGGHVLIIPIAHYSAISEIPPESSMPIRDEIDKYKKALRQCYAKYDAGLVASEIVRPGRNSGHAHIQVCPVPLSLSGQIKEKFIEAGRAESYNFREVPPSPTNSQFRHQENGSGYIKVDLPDGSSMLHVINRGQMFNIQFCRSVLADALGTPERKDWRAALSSSEDQEKVECNMFKEAFKSFDPTV